MFLREELLFVGFVLMLGNFPKREPILDLHVPKHYFFYRATK